MQNLDHNIVEKVGYFFQKYFFCRKLSKIAENCDHNIDPCTHTRVEKLYQALVVHNTYAHMRRGETGREFDSRQCF
jgi:hypothetical protein